MMIVMKSPPPGLDLLQAKQHRQTILIIISPEHEVPEEHMVLLCMVCVVQQTCQAMQPNSAS